MVRLKKVAIEEEIELIYGKSLTKTTREDGLFNVYGSNGVIGTHSSAIFKGPGIIVGRKGTVGSVVLSKKDFYAIDTTYVVKLNDIKDDLIFWYYFLKTLGLENMNSHSAVPGLSRDAVYKKEVQILGNFEDRVAVGKVLSCLDEKIELNNSINKNLEEIAQAIFKSWFVDFEPFQEGEFDDSELGRIPKGWTVVTLKDIVDSIDNRGKTPPLTSQETLFPIIDVRALSGDSRIIDYNNCTKYVEEVTYNNWFRSGHPKHQDILISTVGSLAELKIFYGDKGCVAQNVVGFRSKGLSPLYLYQYLHNIKQDLISYNIGSVQPSIKVTHIIKHKILVPDEKTLNLFEVTLCAISNKIFENSGEVKKLIEVRDSLLPKLMSGEIIVPVEEVQ
ncbi:MAG: restriction endonuclease subunit S [Mobilitalea sp.]